MHHTTTFCPFQRPVLTAFLLPTSCSSLCGLLALVHAAVPPAAACLCCQDCVKRMLVRDPSKRATAAEVLAHEWIKENGVAGDNEIEPEVLKRIRGFAGEAQGAVIWGA